MNDYKPTSFPAAFGAAAIALTALTIGFAVVVPMHAGSGIRAPAPVASSPVASTASNASAPMAVGERIHIDVVAVRPAAPRATRDGWVPVEARARARKVQPATEAPRSGVRSAARPERVGYQGAVAPARCPYLISGTVSAAS